MNWFVFLFIILTTWPAVAQEDPIEVANQAYLEGMNAYKDGKYEEAIEHLSRSNSLFPRAILSYNIALAQFKLQRFSEGIRQAERAREQGLEPELQDKLNARTIAAHRILAVRDASTVISATQKVAKRDTVTEIPIRETPQESRKTIPAASWVVGTFGIVSLGFALFSEFRVQSFASDLERFSNEGPRDRYDSTLQSVKNWQLAERLALGIGVAAITTAVLITIFRRDRGSVSLTPQGIRVKVRF